MSEYEIVEGGASWPYCLSPSTGSIPPHSRCMRELGHEGSHENAWASWTWTPVPASAHAANGGAR